MDLARKKSNSFKMVKTKKQSNSNNQTEKGRGREREREREKRNLSTDESAECKGGEMAIVHTVLIQMPNVYLNGGMILGCNQPVCG
jgi:hypothetical protein